MPDRATDRRKGRGIRHRPEEANDLLLIRSIGVIPVLIVSFSWFLDKSLPWLGCNGHGRRGFWLVLPVALTSWFLWMCPGRSI